MSTPRERGLVRAAVGLLLLVAVPLASGQVADAPDEAQVQSAPPEAAPPGPALALLLAVVAAGALALMPRRE